MRLRGKVAAVVAGGVLFAAGAVVAQAASADACDAVFKSNTIANLKAYTACRDDRIDATLKQIQNQQNPTPTPVPSPTDQPTSPTPPVPTQTESPTESPTQTPAPPSGGVCKPGSEILKFTGQGSAGMGQYEAGGEGYDASAEEWGVTGYNYQQTMGVCSHASWYIDVTTDNTKADGAVKAYPSMRKMYRNWDVAETDPKAYPQLSSFPKMTIDYAATGPDACSGCIYDTAFDLWFNKSADNSSIEVMVWTENVKQVPGGTKVASGAKIMGHTWDVWSDDSDRYIAYVPTDVPKVPSGTLDVKALAADLSGRGRIEADPKVSQLSFGVEMVSTGAVSKHWDFTNFNVHDGS